MWDGASTTTNPLLGWLVSNPTPGTLSNPATALGDPNAAPTPPNNVAWAVLPAEDNSGGVRVPLVDVSGGKFGYWIADENTKANVVINQPENPVFLSHFEQLNLPDVEYKYGVPKADGGDDFRTEFWRWLLPHRLAVESLSEVDAADLIPVVAQRKVASATSLEAVDLALTSPTPSPSPTPLRKTYFHDLTAVSRSVLTDVPNGRLKVDFQNQKGAQVQKNHDTPAPVNSFGLADFWYPTNWQGNLAANSLANAPSDKNFDPVHQGGGGDVAGRMREFVGLVLTEFGIRFSVYREPGAGNQAIVVKWDVQAEFWNPWNARLKTSGAGQHSIRAHGLPIIEISAAGAVDGNGNPVAGPLTIDLEKLVNREHLAGSYNEPDTEDWPTLFYMTASYDFEPGQTKVYGLSGTSSQMRNVGGNVNPAPREVRVRSITPGNSGSATARFKNFKIPETSSITVDVAAITNGNLSDTDFATRNLAAYSNNPDPAHDFQVTLGRTWTNGANATTVGGDNPYLIYVPEFSFDATTVVNTNPTDSSWLFGYGFEMRDDLAEIVKTQDPRSRPFKYEMIEPESTSVWSSDPTANISGINAAGGRYFRSGTPGLVLFELPRDMPLSIGAMQHATSDVAYQLGSPQPSGSEFTQNSLFDEAFFSGVQRIGDSASKPGAYFLDKDFANPFTTLYSDPMNPLPAVNVQKNQSGSTGLMSPFRAPLHLMIEGGFNINSISISAWEIMLSGINLPLDPANATTTGWPHKGGARRSLERAFFRFPYSSTNRTTLDDEATLQSLSPSDLEEQAFVPQIRSLSVDQVEDLAEGVVEATKSRGKPWASVKEFVDTGVLAHLLDPTGTDGDSSLAGITPVAGINQNFIDYKYSPIYLTQQDILTTIAPFINVRGDTFLVRAYGDRRNPKTGKVMATALCEAVVQRVPTPAGLAAPLTEPPPITGSAKERDNDQVITLNPTQFPLGRKFNIVSIRWL